MAKKEHLKKSLGITEYPWSSDEEDNDIPQPSISGTNHRQFENVMQRPTTSSASLFQPSTSTPTTHSSSLPNVPTSATRARMDRNLFWSLICHPNTTQVDIVQRQANRAEAAARHREMVRPASVIRRPDSLARARTSPLREIRGILAIKKATRQITSARNLVYSSAFSGQPRGPQLTRKNPIFTRRPAAMPGHLSVSSSSTSWSPAGEPQPSTSSGRRLTPDAHAHVTHDVHAHDTRAHDVRDSNAHEILAQERLALEAFADIPQLNTTLENDAVEAGPSNGNETMNVSTEMSLEEEVLEVEPAQEATEVRSDESGANNSSGDAAPAGDAAGAADDSRGVKRKREGSVPTDAKDDSVKELNQCLLRLLECPVCLEWMEPPMSQCRRGHLVCVKCRARLTSCPVCRTTFSSVRNRAMEGVAEMLRYPCRHGCLREVRLRRRASHEANCARRRYACPAAACAARPPLPHQDLAQHFQTKHPTMVKFGRKQKFSVKVNAEQHDNWIIMALHEIFHLRIDVDIRTWGVTIYVAFVGPKSTSRHYSYEVAVVGKHNARRLAYTRATHSDLESASLNVCRQDCFHLSLDQALNFLRIKNRHCETDNSLNVSVAIMKNEDELDRDDSADS